jgi:DDE superfamily endonuclease
MISVRKFMLFPTVQKKLRPLVQAVATAFPHAQVELWTMDEHRIGLNPILHKVWCFDHERPIAPVQHRYDWRYVVGFVHPASGRTVFHLATSVNLGLFAVELEAFARKVGAGPRKQIVLVLDRAGWHASLKLRVPEHVHLLFLPAFSPELQPAEHRLAFDQYGARQPALCYHRGFGRSATRAVCRLATPSRTHPPERPCSIGGLNGSRNDKVRGILS